MMRRLGRLLLRARLQPTRTNAGLNPPGVQCGSGDQADFGSVFDDRCEIRMQFLPAAFAA